MKFGESKEFEYFMEGKTIGDVYGYYPISFSVRNLLSTPPTYSDGVVFQKSI